MSLWSDFRSALGGRGVTRDVDEELEAHLLHRVDDLLGEGVAPDEARARAEAEFGDVARIREACAKERMNAARRDVIPVGVAVLGQDLVYAARQLRRSPGFAAVAVLTLALGIGATTTIFGVVDSVVLAPLPFHDPDRLVFVKETTPGGDPFSVAEPNYLDWRARASTFSDLAASTERTATWTGDGEPRDLRSAWVSASFLDVLGVEPVLGRGIQSHEDRPGERGAVTVLGYEAWQRIFGGDPSVTGRSLLLDGVTHTVVGVLPPEISFLNDVDVLVPLGADPATDRGDHYLDVVGRLAPGSSMEAAREEMAALARSIADAHPEIAGWGTRLVTVRETLVGPGLERAGWVLLGAAALLLLIACVNVSNLMLARASARREEVGVRMALGAGRGRIARQLLTESLLLSSLGGAAGLALTHLAIPAVQTLGGGRIPRLDEAAVSPAVVLTCLGAIVGAAVLFGLAPILDLRGGRAAEALRSARHVDSGGSRRMRSGMVVTQVALSVMLLLGTGLLVRSFLRLTAADPGFDPDRTMTLAVSMPDRVYDAPTRQLLVREILDATRAVPGVLAAGATAVAPFQGMNLANFAAREDRMPADRRDFLPIAWRVVTPGFFRAMGTDLLAGRAFREDDGWENGLPVIISATLAEELWPEGDAFDADGAVGSTLVWGDPQGSRMTVVGVVSDLRDIEPGELPLPIIYRTHRQIPWAAMTVVARVRETKPGTAAAIRAAVRRAAPGVALPDVGSLRAFMRDAVAAPRFNVLVLGAFAAAGLLLALVGVYGVTSFAVSRRVREIGIRLALGGDPSDIRRMVLAQSLRMAVFGVVLGSGAAWLASRWVAGLLYETGPHDPVIWVTVPLALLGAALGAAYVPARRATRVHPREALAEE